MSTRIPGRAANQAGHKAEPVGQTESHPEERAPARHHGLLRKIRTVASASSDRTRRGGAFVVLLCLCCSLVGLALGYALLPAPVPEPLRQAQAVTSVPVGRESFVDERSVKVIPQVETGQSVVWQGGGIVTAITMENATIASGSSPFAVDDTPIIALHTGTPLYRDLAPGATGSDVGALREELGRLGYQVDTAAATHNVYDGILQTAVIALQRQCGAGPTGIMAISRVVWIAQPSVSLARSSLVLGQSAPQEIGSPVESLQSLSVAMPSDLAPGARTLSIGGAELAMPDVGDGVISDSASLDIVRQSEAFRAWQALPDDQRSKGLDATLRLRDPVEAFKVPAGSVFALHDDRTACVQSKGRKVPVTVYGSLNGYAMIGADAGQKLTAVDKAFAVKDRSCPARSAGSDSGSNPNDTSHDSSGSADVG